MSQEPRISPAAPAAQRRLQRRGPKFIPLLIFLAVIGFILYQEVPAVHDGVERLLRPAQWQAAQTCRQAALAAATQPATARVVDAGRVHATQEGYYVEALRIGEMGEDGRELHFDFSCYIDGAGALLQGQRSVAR